MSTTKQHWSCPVCGHTYDSPIVVRAVYCPKTHITTKGRTSTGQALMTLTEPSPTKGTPHGKS